MVQIPSNDLPSLYAGFMRQIKSRLETVKAITARYNETDDGIDRYLILETCTLHVRMIIELTALAALTAHNEIEDFRTKSFVREYRADSLMKALTKANKYAFPIPIKIEKMGDDGIADMVFWPLDEADKETLNAIYRSCGDVLHVGHLRSLISAGGKSIYVDDVTKQTNYLVELLNEHVIILPDQRRMMVCYMAYRPTNDVHCFLTDFEVNAVIDPRNFDPPQYGEYSLRSAKKQG